MKQRQLAISTPLGEGKLVLNRMELRERLNAPFEIDAELSALDGNVDYNQIVGHPVTITLDLPKRGKRHFSGLVSRMTQTGNRGGFARYRALIVPWLWFLTRTSDCRIYQRLSVIDMAEQVFDRARFGSEYYQLRTYTKYPKRRYCVQYRETDFNFVNRLLESEGITYWFEHTPAKHRLVLADRIDSSKSRAGYETVDYHEVEGAEAEGREVITQWVVEQEVQSVGYLLKDFDFKKPGDPLQSSHQVTREHGLARFAAYDYPGDYFEPGEGERYAQLRLEELQAHHLRVQATTTARGLAAGQVFELRQHPRADQNRKYLITDLTLTVDSGEFSSGGAGGEFFQCHFTAIPASVPYRPARITPKPVIQGTQTATVTGRAGEEIHTDKHGRVKVHFHWDRHGQPDENSSCWVRVSQPWAGKGFGGMNVPRIGQEVVVEFLEGDPDRPLINGRIYNADNMPYPSNAGRDGKPGNAKPPTLAQAAMMTSLKSNSLGGSGGYNEITMNDTGGQEGLHFKAQKDEIHNVGNDREDTVANNETRKVGVDRTRDVGNNEKITIGSNRTEDVGGNETLSVAKSRTRNVGKSETVTVALMRTHSVGVNEAISVGAAQEITVGGMQAISVGAMQAISVGLNQINTIGADRSSNVGVNDSLSVGKGLSITAGEFIEISCGASKLTMGSDGKVVLAGVEFHFLANGNVVLVGKQIDLNP